MIRGSILHVRNIGRTWVRGIYQTRTMKVDGKVAIVTGGAQGMGRGFVEALLKAGAKVSVVDYNDEVGQTATSELGTQFGAERVLFCKCDISRQADMEETFRKTKETFGGVDIVVNNAGVGGETDENWERTVDINLKGTLRGIRLAMHYLSNKNGGNGGLIINMASAAGLNPNPFSPIYAATKAGIIHATRSLAVSSDALESNIRLNVMCPAFVDTPMMSNLASNGSDVASGDSEKVAAFIKHIGIMTVDEVVEGFMQIVEDDTKNGEIMRCSKNLGNVYCKLTVDNCD